MRQFIISTHLVATKVILPDFLSASEPSQPFRSREFFFHPELQAVLCVFSLSEDRMRHVWACTKTPLARCVSEGLSSFSHVQKKDFSYRYFSCFSFRAALACSRVLPGFLFGAGVPGITQQCKGASSRLKVLRVGMSRQVTPSNILSAFVFFTAVPF